MLSFGARLKNLRISSDMTQLDLSKKLNVSRATVGRYETEERFPDKETLIKLADIFNVSLDFLLGREYKNINISSITLNDSLDPYSVSTFIHEILLENLKKLNIETNIINDSSFLNNVITYGLQAGLKIYLLEKNQNM
ncbi:helix-turn-helix domain-containing protein [Peptoniphilus indolicus]|uniref:HTH-type transcriptional regulator immR n=1 Tax=Peptoniphilus indolicus TaxID=33030 RepID=A0A379DAL3_9FIRM|nr:helix-turn-helix transcriptional regulator [Peptoniphilus indolicus]SUB75028.1 HTH-type transcriptional regulator immR [Peptoniphilus indolicus]